MRKYATTKHLMEMVVDRDSFAEPLAHAFLQDDWFRVGEMLAEREEKIGRRIKRQQVRDVLTSVGLCIGVPDETIGYMRRSHEFFSGLGLAWRDTVGVPAWYAHRIHTHLLRGRLNEYEAKRILSLSRQFHDHTFGPLHIGSLLRSAEGVEELKAALFK